MRSLNVKVAGTWQKAKGVYVNVASVWNRVKIVWVRYAGQWRKTHVDVLIPAGSILIFRGSVIPTGFTRYTGADGRFIVGAGLSYSLNFAGGVPGVGYVGTLNTTGSHVGSGSITRNQYGGGVAGDKDNSVYAGSHNHTFNLSWTPTDVYKDYILIQANADTHVIPVDAAVLGHSLLSVNSELVNFDGINRFLRSSSSYGALGGSDTHYAYANSSTNGSHYHYSNSGGVGDSSVFGAGYITTGGHYHYTTGVLNLNTKYRYLSTWVNNSGIDIVGVENMIILWDQATIPSGYALCDGTNGTPDMRDYFLKIGTTANHNTSGGDNNASLTVTTNTAGAHSHASGTANGNPFSGSLHADTVNAHQHSMATSFSIEQVYKSLYFIMKLP